MFKDLMKGYRKAKRTHNKIKKAVKTVEKITGTNTKSTRNTGANPRVSFFQSGKQATMDEIDVMTGQEFELVCKGLFEKQGYRVSTTKTSGDFGADLVLEKSGKKIVVQVKRSKSNIGVSAIQEIVSAIPVYQADESWVITNAFYTQAAITLAQANGVRLLNRDDLTRFL